MKKYQFRQLADCEQRDGGGRQEEVSHLPDHFEGDDDDHDYYQFEGDDDQELDR